MCNCIRPTQSDNSCAGQASIFEHSKIIDRDEQWVTIRKYLREKKKENETFFFQLADTYLRRNAK